MSEKPEVWRLLNEGEIVQDGDEILNSLRQWQKTICGGAPCSGTVYRRRLTADTDPLCAEWRERCDMLEKKSCERTLRFNQYSKQYESMEQELAAAREQLAVTRRELNDANEKYAEKFNEAASWKTIAERWQEAADRSQQPADWYKPYDEGVMRAMQAMLTEAREQLAARLPEDVVRCLREIKSWNDLKDWRTYINIETFCEKHATVFAALDKQGASGLQKDSQQTTGIGTPPPATSPDRLPQQARELLERSESLANSRRHYFLERDLEADIHAYLASAEPDDRDKRIAELEAELESVKEESSVRLKGMMSARLEVAKCQHWHTETISKFLGCGQGYKEHYVQGALRDVILAVDKLYVPAQQSEEEACEPTEPYRDREAEKYEADQAKRRDYSVICHNCGKSYMNSQADETNRCPECRGQQPAEQLENENMLLRGRIKALNELAKAREESRDKRIAELEAVLFTLAPNYRTGQQPAEQAGAGDAGMLGGSPNTSQDTPAPAAPLELTRHQQIFLDDISKPGSYSPELHAVAALIHQVQQLSARLIREGM